MCDDRWVNGCEITKKRRQDNVTNFLCSPEKSMGINKVSQPHNAYGSRVCATFHFKIESDVIFFDSNFKFLFCFVFIFFLINFIVFEFFSVFYLQIRIVPLNTIQNEDNNRRTRRKMKEKCAEIDQRYSKTNN